MKSGIIGVIGAMDNEIELLKSSMVVKTTDTVAGMTYYCGMLSGCPVALVRCGIGKVNAAICAQTLIHCFGAEQIINTGVAGSLDNEIDIGDIVVSRDAVQHDMDTTALGDELGLISGLDMVHIPTDEGVTKLLESVTQKLGIKYKTGTVATGDCFINTNEKKNFLIEKFSAIACEMEGAAVVQTCYINKIPCSIMRAISDGGDDNSHTDYKTFARKAAKTSAEVITEFVKEWK